MQSPLKAFFVCLWAISLLIQVFDNQYNQRSFVQKTTYDFIFLTFILWFFTPKLPGLSAPVKQHAEPAAGDLLRGDGQQAQLPPHRPPPLPQGTAHI